MSLNSILLDFTSPFFSYGTVPPPETTAPEKVEEICKKFVHTTQDLAVDAFIVYDIQEEKGRTEIERPFPYKKPMNNLLYADILSQQSSRKCIVYKSVVEDDESTFLSWIESAKKNHTSFNYVGGASSKVTYGGINIEKAGELSQSHPDLSFGCVCIPERHMSKGSEHNTLLEKSKWGAQWFITQAIYSEIPVIQLINDYSSLCKSKNESPKKIILTFAPCANQKTMSFIKWLGVTVPSETEERILSSPHPITESITTVNEILLKILAGTSGSGVSLGINVESLSLNKEEVDGSKTLFRELQATMLNFLAKPWVIRWSFVNPTDVPSQSEPSAETATEITSLKDTVSQLEQAAVQSKSEIEGLKLKITQLEVENYDLQLVNRHFDAENVEEAKARELEVDKLTKEIEALKLQLQVAPPTSTEISEVVSAGSAATVSDSGGGDVVVDVPIAVEVVDKPGSLTPSDLKQETPIVAATSAVPPAPTTNQSTTKNPATKATVAAAASVPASARKGSVSSEGRGKVKPNGPSVTSPMKPTVKPTTSPRTVTTTKIAVQPSVLPAVTAPGGAGAPVTSGATIGSSEGAPSASVVPPVVANVPATATAAPPKGPPGRSNPSQRPGAKVSKAK